MKTELVRMASKAVTKTKKMSPELLVIGGIAGFVVATVTACKATLQLQELVDKANEDIENVKAYVQSPDAEKEGYDEETAKKAIRMLKVKTGLAAAKLYLPTVTISVISATAILKSHNIMTRRNAILGAAYTALESSFKDYRGNVVERFGEGVDKELLYNIKKQKVEEEIITEDGKKKKVKKDVEVVGDKINSPYAKFFDESSREWTKSPEYNLQFLISQQNYFNNLLKANGHVFLNEVYDILDIPRTSIGAVCGWIYDPSNPDTDDVIDFGIHEYSRENRRFVNGLEPVILLDFNCEGNIVNRI